jgi:hypothetical protein
MRNFLANAVTIPMKAEDHYHAQTGRPWIKSRHSIRRRVPGRGNTQLFERFQSQLLNPGARKRPAERTWGLTIQRGGRGLTAACRSPERTGQRMLLFVSLPAILGQRLTILYFPGLCFFHVCNFSKQESAIFRS